MQKIGQDIVDSKSRFATTLSHRPHDEKWKQRILAILKQAETPLNVNEIYRRLDCGTWVTVKQALLELERQGKVEFFRSGKLFLFKTKHSESLSSHNQHYSKRGDDVNSAPEI